MRKKFTYFLVLIGFLGLLSLSFYGGKKVIHISELISTQTNNVLPKTHPLLEKSSNMNLKFKDFKSSEKLALMLVPSGELLALDPISIQSVNNYILQLEGLGFTEVQSYTNLEFAFERNSELQFGTLSEVKLSTTIKNSVSGNQIFVPTFIGKDLRSVHLYAVAPPEFKLSSLEILSAIALQNKLKLRHAISKDLMAQQITKELGAEVLKNIGLSFLILFLLVSILYRSLKALLFHVLLLSCNLLSTMAVVGLAGLKLNSLSVSLPIILIIIQISLGSHLLPKLFKDQWSSVLLKNRTPLLIALGSTFIGFASLSLSSSPYLKEYSYIMSLGIAVSATHFFAFAWVFCLFQNTQIELRDWSSTRRYIHFLENCFDNPRFVRLAIIGSICVIGLGFASKAFLNYDGPANALVKADSAIAKSKAYFAGSVLGHSSSFLELSSEEEDFWENSKRLANLDHHIKQWMSLYPQVVSGTSYADSVKLFTIDGRIPSSNQEISEISFLMGMMGADTSGFTSTSKKNLRIHLKSRETNHKAFKQSVDKLKTTLRQNFKDVTLTSFGGSYDSKPISLELSQFLYWGFLSTMGVILAFLMLAWRDPKLVLLAALPNLLPVASINLFLYFAGYSFDPSLAIIFSIAVGVSFDNTIFLLNSFQKHIGSDLPDRKMDWKLGEMLNSNLSIMICFSVFLFSSNEINIKFGLLMSFAIFAAYFADSFFLPSMLKKLYPEAFKLGYSEAPQGPSKQEVAQGEIYDQVS